MSRPYIPRTRRTRHTHAGIGTVPWSTRWSITLVTRPMNALSIAPSGLRMGSRSLHGARHASVAHRCVGVPPSMPVGPRPRHSRAVTRWRKNNPKLTDPKSNWSKPDLVVPTHALVVPSPDAAQPGPDWLHPSPKLVDPDPVWVDCVPKNLPIITTLGPRPSARLRPIPAQNVGHFGRSPPEVVRPDPGPDPTWVDPSTHAGFDSLHECGPLR